METEEGPAKGRKEKENWKYNTMINCAKCNSQVKENED